MASETVFKITGFLASHFCADEISASQLREAYLGTERVLSNANEFPNADFPFLERLSEELFQLSPGAAMVGELRVSMPTKAGAQQ